jgi:hypothetical protein
MKTSLFIALSALSAASFGQSTFRVLWMDNNNSVINNNTIIYGIQTIVQDNVKTNFDVENTSTSTQEYLAKRYDMELNQGASAYFCFAGTCYAEEAMISETTLTLTPGQKASDVPGSYNILTADLDEWGNSLSPSYVRYSFLNANDPADSLQLTIAYNVAGPVGIRENNIPFASVGLFPNPASQLTHIEISSAVTAESTISLVNPLGQLVYETSARLTEGKNRVSLNVEGLSSGIYSASVRVGTSVISKKLVIE